MSRQFVPRSHTILKNAIDRVNYPSFCNSFCALFIISCLRCANTGNYRSTLTHVVDTSIAITIIKPYFPFLAQFFFARFIIRINRSLNLSACNNNNNNNNDDDYDNDCWNKMSRNSDLNSDYIYRSENPKMHLVSLTNTLNTSPFSMHRHIERKKERKASTSVYESIRWLASKGKHSYVTQLRN